MRHNYFWGVDPGLNVDPTGTVLIRATRPLVTVRDGKVYDSATGAVLKVPEGTTLAEFIAPQYAVVDVQSRKGVTFGQTAREGRALMEDMGGSNFLCACDATGLGVGAVDQIRGAGVPTVAVTLTGGQKISGGRGRINMPVSVMFASMYSVMAQGRLAVTDPAGKRLVDELKEIERRVNEDGREHYDVATGEGHHGDTVFACAMALIIAERRIGRQHRNVSLNPGGYQRRPGRPRQGNTAKRVIAARLEQSRLQSEAEMWRQIGADKLPDFD